MGGICFDTFPTLDVHSASFSSMEIQQKEEKICLFFTVVQYLCNIGCGWERKKVSVYCEIHVYVHKTYLFHSGFLYSLMYHSHMCNY